MKRPILAVVISVMISSFSPPVWSKGMTVKLVVHGENLSSPLEVTDSEIVHSFSIWNGPGVRVNGEPVHLNPDNPGKAFIDWPRGLVVERPGGLDRYEVTFFLDRRRVFGDRYVIIYEFDLSTPGGYIYLPGQEDTHGRDNTRLIVHGVEGNWFHSSRSWEYLARIIHERP